MVPRISIIVPVYNVEGILKYCVDSLLAQTFSDLEILLVDDGSKDNSSAICDEYLKVDSRIKVFHKTNGGLSDARNYGIERACGDNILFIDSDDVLHKDFCRILIELQNKYSAEIVSTSLINFYEFDEIEALNQKIYDSEEVVFRGSKILSEYYNPKGEIKIYHGLCMKLYKKTLFENLRFEKGRLHEDLFITYQLLNKASTFVYIDRPYYYYFQKNTNSITKNYKEKNLMDEYDALQFMLSFFKDRDDIKNDLYTFVTKHFCYLVGRTYSLPKTKTVLEKRKLLKQWIYKNIDSCSNFSKAGKFKIKLIMRNYSLFYLFNNHG